MVTWTGFSTSGCVVARNLHTIHPLVEKPVQVTIPLQVHHLAHVLLYDRLKGFSGRCPFAMALHKVMHHSDEWLVVILRAVHYGAQHLQDVCTLGIGYILVGIFGTRRNQAQSHPEGA